MAPHVSQWHGINLPLIFSIIVIILGIILATKSKLESVNAPLNQNSIDYKFYRKALAYLNIMLVVVFVV